MSTYSAPIKDQQFILHEVLRLSQSNIPGYSDQDRSFTEAVLNESGKLAHAVIAPLNAVVIARAVGGRQARFTHPADSKTPLRNSNLAAGPGLICRSNMADNPCPP